MDKSLILKLARIVLALVLALAYGPEIAHALWAVPVWLFHHPWLGGPSFVVMFILVPLMISAHLDAREAGR